MPMSTAIRLPVNAPSYSTGGANFYIDRTGAIYQTWVGRTTAGGDWGSHVYRTAPGSTPQLIWFEPGCNGYLEVINYQLWLGYCDARGLQWRLLIDGYIDPSDKPSSTIIDVNEAQVQGLKSATATAQQTADRASSTASAANATANATNVSMQQLKARVTTLEQQVAALQTQVNNLLTPNQVADLVWSKVWDINYQIRMGFLAGKSPIEQVQDYLNDLAVYIKKVMKS